MRRQQTFGEWLDDQLHEHNWTQAAFAETVGVARQTVGNWINEIKPPRRRAARDIARALGVPEDEVLMRMGYPPRDPDYRLPEEQPRPETGDIDLSDPLVRVFASHSGELSAQEREFIVRIVKGLRKLKDDAEGE